MLVKNGDAYHGRLRIRKQITLTKSKAKYSQIESP